MVRDGEEWRNIMHVKYLITLACEENITIIRQEIEREYIYQMNADIYIFNNDAEYRVHVIQRLYSRFKKNLNLITRILKYTNIK